MVEQSKRHLCICVICEQFSYLQSFESITNFYREHRTKHIGKVSPPNLKSITVMFDGTETGDAWLTALLKWRTEHADS